jgi:putative solute:sodium symporter small subunit
MTEIDSPTLAEQQRKQRVQAALDRYWRSNLRIMAALLVLWAAPSFGCGILIADWLNQFRLPFTGFPLGFWFAQQGSIAIFVLCILIYCLAMNRLDRKHHEELIAIEQAIGSAGGAGTASGARS